MSIAYVHSAPSGPRDIIDAASCAHHYAPSNLAAFHFTVDADGTVRT